MNIVLTGFMGTGKTTVGRRLADALHVKFVDVDDTIRKVEARENIMCGGGPVASLLVFAEKAGPAKVEILARTDSSGYGGPVVGYLAAAVLSAAPQAPEFTLTAEEKAALLKLARTALTEYVTKGTEIDDLSGRLRIK